MVVYGEEPERQPRSNGMRSIAGDPRAKLEKAICRVAPNLVPSFRCSVERQLQLSDGNLESRAGNAGDRRGTRRVGVQESLQADQARPPDESNLGRTSILSSHELRDEGANREYD